MKTVYLLRHGKSKRGPEYDTDFERPLAKRGKRDSVRMGEYMAERGYVPDLILSSPAERARDTAIRCAEAAGYQGEARLVNGLYFTGDDVYLELLWELDDAIGSVLFVGHNPTTEAVIEILSRRYARMPTAALARIDFDVECWMEVEAGEGKLVWVQLPRNL
jgi:phosphohistidine phosphatase